MRFQERNPLEEGFAEIFEQSVWPKLEALEGDRILRLAKAKKHVGLALAAGLVGWGLVFAIWKADGLFGYVAVFLLASIAALMLWKAQSSGWNNAVEETIMPPICAHVGNLEFRSSGSNFPIGQFRSLNLLPNYNRSTLKNALKGTHHDTKYELIQAKLSRQSNSSKGGSKSQTVFSGLLFHIEVPVKAPGRIVLMRDRGGLGNKLGELFSFGGTRSMPKVTFDHSAFEAAFEVYADQPDDAKAFMPARFLDTMLAIGEEQGGRRGADAITAGFQETSFYMALRRSGEFMKMGSLRTPVTEMDVDLHAIFDDIALSHQIIDRLHGA